MQGCAAFFERKYENITINSLPAGADVYIMGRYAGATPLITQVRKGSKSVIVDLIKLDYKPHRFVIYSKGQDVSMSPFCKFDHYFGWFLLGIPIQIDKLFSKKCYFFYKTDFLEKMDLDINQIKNSVN